MTAWGSTKTRALCRRSGRTSTRSFARSCSPTWVTASRQRSPAVWSLVGRGAAGVGWSPKSVVTRVVRGSRVAAGCGSVVIIISPLVEGGGGACGGPCPGFSLHALACDLARSGTLDQGGVVPSALRVSMGAPLLGVRIGVEVLDVIGRFLRLRGRVHQQ